MAIMKKIGWPHWPLSTATLAAQAQVTGTAGRKLLSSAYTGTAYSPYAGRDFATDVYWGDTHLHTDISMDAGAFGNRLGLDEAYRFARGEQVESTNGGPVRLSRPLDFLVVADHSDNMGFFPDMLAGAPIILDDPTGKDWYDRIKAGEGVGVALELIGLFSQGNFPPAWSTNRTHKPYKDAWAKTVEAAERYNEPGASRHLSATSGPRWCAATICTALWYTATAATRAGKWCPIPPSPPGQHHTTGPVDVAGKV